MFLIDSILYTVSMIRNDEIHKQAITFRKRGFTYAEIAKICGVHKSTVARWCSGKRFSKQIAKDNVSRANRENAKRIALLQKARQTERNRAYQSAEESARTEFAHHLTDPDFMAGLMVYRTCGDRTDSGVLRVTSQDWFAHKLWQRFIAKYFGVSREKIRFYLVLYANHDVSNQEKFWSRQLAFPMERFGKTQVVRQQVKRLHNGTGNTIIGNTVQKRKLTVWLSLIEKQYKN